MFSQYYSLQVAKSETMSSDKNPEGWLAVPGRGLSSEVEESPSGGVFSNRWNIQVARCDA